jgi:hypothetical protein
MKNRNFNAQPKMEKQNSPRLPKINQPAGNLVIFSPVCTVELLVRKRIRAEVNKDDQP